jgi:DNA repair protein RAD5
VAKLLDYQILELSNCTVVDCPTNLYSGVDLILSVNTYLKPSAFGPPSTSSKSGQSSKKLTMLSEGEETSDEELLRERKVALLKLFEVIGLRPTIEGLTSNSSKDESRKSDDVTPRAPNSENTCDVEVLEAEEGEELDETQLDIIYRKCAWFLLRHSLRLTYLLGLKPMTVLWVRWTLLRRLL